jgi:hypothetical protein
VPWLRSLVAGLLPWRPGFAPVSVHVGFVVDIYDFNSDFSEVVFIYRTRNHFCVKVLDAGCVSYRELTE